MRFQKTHSALFQPTMLHSIFISCWFYNYSKIHRVVFSESRLYTEPQIKGINTICTFITTGLTYERGTVMLDRENKEKVAWLLEVTFDESNSKYHIVSITWLHIFLSRDCHSESKQNKYVHHRPPITWGIWIVTVTFSCDNNSW